MRSPNLRYANLEGANPGRDNLGGATSLHSANLDGAQVSGAQLTGANYDDRTNFPLDFSPDKAGMVNTAKGRTDNAAREAKRFPGENPRR